jgi:hypothetical protein
VNLLQMGTHAAADWLRIKVRSHYGRATLFVRNDGQMFAGGARNAPRCPPYAREVGTFDRRLRYLAAVEHMTELRDELHALQAEDMAA